MFVDKSKKGYKKAPKVSIGSKSQKRKPPSVKPIQSAVAASNTLFWESLIAF